MTVQNVMYQLAFCAALIMLTPFQAAAQSCINPPGDIGDVIYNNNYDVFQGCTYGANWIALHLPQCPDGSGCDPCVTGPVGTRCNSDGAIYVGTTVGDARMYAAPCDHGMTWNGTSCTGSETRRRWKTTNTATTGTDDPNDGVTNTDEMAVAGFDDHPAGEACRNIGAEWYLPARNEQNTIWNNLVDGAPDDDGDDLTDDFFFDISGSYYWSSTEHNISAARNKRFSDGYQSNFNKGNLLPVRCVRR